MRDRSTHPKLGEHTACEKETRAVAGGIVGETNVDTVLGELLRVRRLEHNVTRHCRVHNLARHVLVRDACDKAVLLCVVLVLVLEHKAAQKIEERGISW